MSTTRSARLLAVAKAEKVEFELMLTRFALERFLYRLSISAQREQFLLNGALLFDLWFDEPHRPTRDADFLGFGPADLPTMEATFREIAALKVDDGITFDPFTVKAQAVASSKGAEASTIQFLSGTRLTYYQTSSDPAPAPPVWVVQAQHDYGLVCVYYVDAIRGVLVDRTPRMHSLTAKLYNANGAIWAIPADVPETSMNNAQIALCSQCAACAFAKASLTSCAWRATPELMGKSRRHAISPGSRCISAASATTAVPSAPRSTDWRSSTSAASK